MESTIEDFATYEVILYNDAEIIKVRSMMQFTPLQGTAYSPFEMLSTIEDDTIVNVQGRICFIGKTQTKMSRTGSRYDTQLIMLEDNSGNKV